MLLRRRIEGDAAYSAGRRRGGLGIVGATAAAGLGSCGDVEKKSTLVGNEPPKMVEDSRGDLDSVTRTPVLLTSSPSMPPLDSFPTEDLSPQVVVAWGNNHGEAGNGV